MSTHNICFCAEIRKKYCADTLLSGAMHFENDIYTSIMISILLLMIVEHWLQAITCVPFI